VGYVATTWEKDGRFLPRAGNWDRTAGELIQALAKCKGDIGSVIGDYKPEAGAWIRFNPLDGKGCKNENVTEFRYALVESDSMPVGKQLALIKQMELPVAVLVHSGAKSMHAIVRIDAPTYDEYRKRVDYLYAVCKKNGLAVDAQNKNPSRLSRMPGIMRDGRKQFLVDTNIGRESWEEWQTWIEVVTDVLPVDITNGDQEWDDDIVEPVEIIEGILGTNEKLMISSSSKAGKSIALLELCTAIANGGTWMGAQCRQGDVLYVNFELKSDSRKRRVKKICAEMGYEREHAHRMHFFDLRGLSAPLDKLTAKIVRQAAKYQCSVIIIDPIYKVMTGDENNAEAVSSFCNQLDNLGRVLDCSIVYCHHYSKGQQGQKASMDRASGSGVFARDADALIAMTELEVTEELRASHKNDKVCAYITAWLTGHGHESVREDLSQDIQVVEKDYRSALRAILPTDDMNALIAELDVLIDSISKVTAWKLECTLRDFAPHDPIDVWYRYPIHETDAVLSDAKIKDMVKDPHKKGTETAAEHRKADRDRDDQKFRDAVANASFSEHPTTAEAMAYMGLKPSEKADKDKFDRILKRNKADGYTRVRDEDTNQWIIVAAES
ncbi:MAG: AAA family ATPase, partial [Actinomycetes bacterium]